MVTREADMVGEVGVWGSWCCLFVVTSAPSSCCAGNEMSAARRWVGG